MKNYIILICLILQISVNAQNWELKKNKNGVKVYTRKTQSGYYEFKAMTTIDASINQVYNIIADANNYSSWIDQVSFSKLISKNNSSFTVYYQIDLPAGVRNRDIILYNQIVTYSTAVIKVDLKCNNTAYNIEKSYTRIDDAYGYWLFEASGGKSSVTYQFYSNPKGNFPAWLINLFIVDGPYETLINLKQKFE